MSQPYLRLFSRVRPARLTLRSSLVHTYSRTYKSSSQNLSSTAVPLPTFSMTTETASIETLQKGASPSHSYRSSVAVIPGLTNAPEEALPKPHHITNRDGTIAKFKNPYPSYAHSPGPSDLFTEILWPMLKGDIKSPDTKPPNTVATITPHFLPADEAPSSLRATWLGHACYYLEFPSGLRVLFDPVFDARCSPFSFMGPKRFTKSPIESLAALPRVDAVAISHSHYDHLSHSSVLEVQKHHPDAHFFVGLGLEKWFRSAGIEHVTEMDWWEEAELRVFKKAKDGEKPEEITAKVGCLPAQHTSARGLFDKNHTLWASWSFESGGKSAWFGGDTGYRGVPSEGTHFDDLPKCPQFKQIGEQRGPFDLGMIPIGAYYPRSMFSSDHANPYDAVEIFKDTGCKQAMGIHWGTWVLTYEEVLEPPRMLKDALRASGIAEEGVFDVCQIGESREF